LKFIVLHKLVLYHIPVRAFSYDLSKEKEEQPSIFLIFVSLY